MIGRIGATLRRNADALYWIGVVMLMSSLPVWYWAPHGAWLFVFVLGGVIGLTGIAGLIAVYVKGKDVANDSNPQDD